MTDKVQKIKDWIQTHKLCTMDEHMKFYCKEAESDYNLLCSIEKILDSLQEEPVSNPIDFEKELYKAFGQVKDFTLGMRIAKWFYDMGKNSQEPVSEDLEEAADNCYYRNHACARESFIEGAQWQKQQMMKDSVLCGVDGWFINNKRNCRKNGRFHKYYVSTITHDKPLPMENGKDYRLIVITED